MQVMGLLSSCEHTFLTADYVQNLPQSILQKLSDEMSEQITAASKTIEERAK